MDLGNFDHRHYVPVLLTRQGELHALRETPDHVKQRFTPLFAIHPIPKDPDTGTPKLPEPEHILKVSTQLAKDWGPRPAFVDVRHLDSTQRMPDGSHLLEAIVGSLADHGVAAAPVLNLSSDHALRRAAMVALGATRTSLCLRLGPEEWALLGTPAGNGAVLSLLSELGATPEQVHLILDAKELAPAAELTAAALRGVLLAIPHLQSWRSLTVAGTGMPSGTGAVGADKNAEVTRTEWQVWRMLLSSSLPRMPTFGDYAVQHPDPVSEFNPRIMDSSAQLRYTIATAWFVVRGRGVKRRGLDQAHRLAAEVTRHPEFAGGRFSWGDAWLEQCAARECSPGSQAVWRKATTNHHLAHVVTQLATQVGA